MRHSTRRPRPGVVILAAVAAGLAIGGPLALASHLFTDVPDASPFHGDIAAIAQAGITTGKTCDVPATPPTYCPLENVTREAMAAFMHRGFGRVAFAALPAVSVPPSETTGPYSITITPGLPAGALAGATGFIKVDAKINVVLTDATTCPCDYWARLALQGGSYVDSSYATVTLSNALDSASIPLTGAVAVQGPAPRTIEIRVFRTTANGGGTGPATISGDATATYHPFGGTGGSTLGAQAPGAAAQQLQPPTPEQLAARRRGRS